MSIEFTINRAKSLVVAVCRGTVSRLEIEDYLDKVVVAEGLPYRKIFDTTDATMALDDADMMALGARIRAYDGISQMGPLAIVAATEESRNRARLFTVLGRADRPAKIFPSMQAAERWLDEQAEADGKPARPTRLRNLLLTL
jgi:hypothetical protein